MVELSVGRVTGRAYGFLFGRLLSVLGLSWLPAVFFGAAVFVLLARVTPIVSQTTLPIDTRELDLLAGASAFVLLLAFFAAVIAVPLTQQALGLREEHAIAHLVIGPRELRLFRALVEVIVVALSTAFVFALLAAFTVRLGLGRRVDALWHGIPVSELTTGTIAVVSLAIGAFLTIRFGFFLFPLAAQEGKARLARAWSLSGASFGRAALASVAIVLPLALALRGIEHFAYGPELSVVLAKVSITHDPTLLDEWIAGHAAQLALVAAVSLVVVTTLIAGASATIYRALTATEGAAGGAPTEASEPWGVTMAPLEARRTALVQSEETRTEETKTEPRPQTQDNNPPEQHAPVPEVAPAIVEITATTGLKTATANSAAMEVLQENSAGHTVSSVGEPAATNVEIVPELREPVAIPDEAPTVAAPPSPHGDPDPVTASFDARSGNAELSTPPSASAHDLKEIDPALAGLPAIFPHDSLARETLPRMQR